MPEAPQTQGQGEFRLVALSTGPTTVRYQEAAEAGPKSKQQEMFA